MSSETCAASSYSAAVAEPNQPTQFHFPQRELGKSSVVLCSFQPQWFQRQPLRFLSRQGLALRGDGDESDSNFMQLINLRSEDDERILDWIKKKTDKYMSPLMQNEMVKVMGLSILRKMLQILEVHYFIPLWWMKQQTWQIQNK